MQTHSATDPVTPDAVKAMALELLEQRRKSKVLWRADLETFAREALIIRPAGGAAMPFTFNSVQRKLHARLENQKAETGKVRAVILKARQLGISTYVGARFYHRMRHDPGFRTIIMAHRDDATLALAEMVDRYYENDPDPPETKVNASGNLVFENDSGVTVMVAGPVKTGAGRAFTFQLAHLSELAFWKQAADHMSALMRTIHKVDGTEIIMESTASGATGVFHANAMAAQAGHGDFELLFFPWFDHDAYRITPPADWIPNDAIREMGERFSLGRDQMFWAESENTQMAIDDGESVDEICWRFQQEFPSTITEAFRAGRKGGYIKGSVVEQARKRVNAHQGDMPLVIGCDFATGGGGENAEYTPAEQLTGTAADAHAQDTEGGDSNVFMSMRGRCKGREVYERFKDRNSVSVADKLQGIIIQHQPDKCFLDRGGGGAQVYDTLCDRGFGRVLELVDFGGKSPDPACRNKRAYMHKRFREWLEDGDIPDDPQLESEITAVWVLREDESGLLLAPKREVRQKLKVSPDGSDAAVLCHAATVRKRNTGPLRVGGAGRR